MRTIRNYSSTTSSTKASSPSSLSLSPPSTHTLQQQQQQQQQPRSPWHSPVPYLFGGLAAMLGLIAFALLILACSYWKLSGRLDEGENGGQERDLENRKEAGDTAEKSVKVYEEKILVIMAGEEKPTFLATPVSSMTTSFGDKKEEEGEEGTEQSKSEEVVKDEEIGIIRDQTETH